MRIAVTGGAGKAGRVVVRDLLEHGHEVLNIDRLPLTNAIGPESEAPYLPADVTDFGQTLEALSGAELLPGIEAVVHLAAIPSPVHATPDQIFRTNITSTHTVFAAAAQLGLKRIVWASSETTLGLPFKRPPDYAPVNEAHVYPETSYALSKVLGEEAARQFSRWSGIPIIGLRFSNVMVREDYDDFPSFWEDPRLRMWNLWGYVDESHVAQSVRRALDADISGADNFIIAAADTVMKRPSRELMAEVFPGVPHQLCQWHALREAAEPLWEADRHLLVEAKQELRPLREVEERTRGRDPAGGDPASGVVLDVVLALRQTVRERGGLPFDFAALRVLDGLEAVGQTLDRCLAKEFISRSQAPPAGLEAGTGCRRAAS